jgi:hypothetical protein
MYKRATVHAALELAGAGENAANIARRLGIPRTTVRDWLQGQLPRHVRDGIADTPDCTRCGHATHRYGELTEAYVYLLGLYLGDGWISRHRGEVYRLRIVLDARYPGIIKSAAAAMQDVRGGVVHVRPRPDKSCSDVSAYWRSWPCLLPQHGAGRKHDRSIVLTVWQSRLVDRWPEQLLRGLIHSDGCRFQNTGTHWSWPRYSFKPVSDDIRTIFCEACDRLGLHWTRARTTIYISRKADVARLDEFIGPKR